jgi:chromosome partitioning protein
VSDVRVFAIANQKGGVGKTTTAVNLAAAVAGAGYDVLIVDIDPQANATVGLGQPRDLEPNVYAVLCGECTAEQAVHATPVDRLWLLPSGRDLVGASVELPTVARSEQRLRDALAPLRERFGFILIDCPPSLGPLTVNALVAADRVIVPVQTEYYALEGLAQVLDTISLIQRELNPRLSVAGMLLTMHDNRTRLGRDVERDVREHFPRAGLRHRDPAQRQAQRGAELRRPGDVARSVLRWVGCLRGTRARGSSRWLAGRGPRPAAGQGPAGWAADCRRSWRSRRRAPRSATTCAISRSS